jgi:hypothetical protein
VDDFYSHREEVTQKRNSLKDRGPVPADVEREYQQLNAAAEMMADVSLARRVLQSGKATESEKENDVVKALGSFESMTPETREATMEALNLVTTKMAAEALDKPESYEKRMAAYDDLADAGATGLVRYLLTKREARRILSVQANAIDRGEMNVAVRGPEKLSEVKAKALKAGITEKEWNDAEKAAKSNEAEKWQKMYNLARDTNDWTQVAKAAKVLNALDKDQGKISDSYGEHTKAKNKKGN